MSRESWRRSAADRHRGLRRRSARGPQTLSRVPMSTSAANGGARDHHGHVLARVVGARRGRVVAVIGRDDRDVARTEPRQQRRQPRIEPLQVRRISVDVVPVAVLGVEIDEVGEDQSGRRASIARSIASIPSSSLAVWIARVSRRGRRTDPRSFRWRRPAGPRLSRDPAASARTASASSRGGSPSCAMRPRFRRTAAR